MGEKAFSLDTPWRKVTPHFDVSLECMFEQCDKMLLLFDVNFFIQYFSSSRRAELSYWNPVCFNGLFIFLCSQFGHILRYDEILKFVHDDKISIIIFCVVFCKCQLAHADDQFQRTTEILDRTSVGSQILRVVQPCCGLKALGLVELYVSSMSYFQICIFCDIFFIISLC